MTIDANAYPYDKVVEDFTEWGGKVANAASGMVDGMKRAIAQEALSTARMVEVLGFQYQIALQNAITSRDAARAAGHELLTAAHQAAADYHANEVFRLSDATTDAAQKLKDFSARINAKLGAFGRYIGPVFDVVAVFDALRNGDGNKAGEAVLSMGVATIGAAGGAIFGTFVGGPGVGTLAGGAAGAIFGAELAKTVNRDYLRPYVLDPIGSWFPDSLWAGLERQFVNGSTFSHTGSAFSDPVNGMIVGGLLQRLQSNISPTTLGQIYAAVTTSPSARETVALTNKLSQLFIPGQPDLADEVSDAVLLARIGQIAQEGKALEGKVSFGLATDGSLATRSKTDFAAFLSISTLNPLLITTTDATAQALLKSKYENLAQKWEADAELTAEQRTQGIAAFSDAWLSDRQQMLQQTIQAYTQNVAANPNGYMAIQGKSTNDFNTRYIDVTKEQRLEVYANRPTPTTLESQYIVFGSAQANSVAGGHRDDHLYGMEGDDLLHGNDGNDYLEGNAGVDTLDGGD